ncbi:MAG TPA: hypothetical protein VGR35_11505 [Tepidisphaeraceae bacterium]|nr:hypothetical protein [Tepidisphaeraceae bacterium]
MLTLPEDWRQCTAGTSARAILSQADDLREYRTAARLRTRACFELLRDSFWGSVVEGGPHILFAERFIRINDFVFLIADAADDAVLEQATHLARTAHEVEVLAPPGTQTLIKEALNSLRASRVTVKPLDDDVDLRALFTGMDTGTDRTAVLSDLLLRYSKLCEDNDVLHLAVSPAGLHPLPIEQLRRNLRRIAPRPMDAPEASSAVTLVKRRDDPINLDTSRRIAKQTC